MRAATGGKEPPAPGGGDPAVPPSRVWKALFLGDAVPWKVPRGRSREVGGGQLGRCLAEGPCLLTLPPGQRPTFVNETRLGTESLYQGGNFGIESRPAWLGGGRETQPANLSQVQRVFARSASASQADSNTLPTPPGSRVDSNIHLACKTFLCTLVSPRAIPTQPPSPETLQPNQQDWADLRLGVCFGSRVTRRRDPIASPRALRQDTLDS